VKPQKKTAVKRLTANKKEATTQKKNGRTNF
jgi:hypothetical protein